MIHTSYCHTEYLKYSGGNIPEGTRFDHYKEFFKNKIATFDKEEGKKQFALVDQLNEFAEKGKYPDYLLSCPDTPLLGFQNLAARYPI